MLYFFEVEYAETHLDMFESNFKKTYAAIEARTEVEASLIAEQMAGRHGIPTATRRLSREEMEGRDG